MKLNSLVLGALAVLATGNTIAASDIKVLAVGVTESQHVVQVYDAPCPEKMKTPGVVFSVTDRGVTLFGCIVSIKDDVAMGILADGTGRSYVTSMFHKALGSGANIQH